MKKILVLTLLMISTFTGCFSNTQEVKIADYTGELCVHFIDVGQADCTFIALPNGECMLIDAGNNDDGNLIKDYLSNLNVTTINYLVGTHPHEDHIGSLDTVINNFDIENLYMPNAESDTKTYRDVIAAIEDNDIEVTYTNAGTTIYADSDMNITAVAPVYDYNDLNDTSIAIRLTYKNSSFLFMGDAEAESENDITMDVSADVLKVGHHGSYTSTTDDFLAKIDPMYAVISCGKDNDYGHPHTETLQKLANDDITIYRTDEMGTIICTTTGGGPADYKWEVK